MTAGERTPIARALERHPRVRLATLPTPLEAGPELPAGARLFVKRDDLTGLGLGGNKARKHEFLCGAALAAGADTLVTAGAAQSNHARITAAAGGMLGLETHLVLGGAQPSEPRGNQLLARLFGATLHFPGIHRWDQLGAAQQELAGDLRRRGRRPYVIPLGGSTATGALGFAAAWAELMDQCERAGVRPHAVVHASSTGGTHGGLLAGRAAWETEVGDTAPPIIAVGVAKEDEDLGTIAARLAGEALDALELGDVTLSPAAIRVEYGWLGHGYAQPTPEADAAMRWAGSRGAWVLDRTYTGKAFAAVLGFAAAGQFGSDEAVVFWHTGGHPAVFVPGGNAVGTHQYRPEKEFA